MNILKDFLINLLVLAGLVAIPFLLMPELLDSLNQLGIATFSLTLLFILLILLAIPARQGRG